MWVQRVINYITALDALVRSYLLPAAPPLLLHRRLVLLLAPSCLAVSLDPPASLGAIFMARKKKSQGDKPSAPRGRASWAQGRVAKLMLARRPEWEEAKKKSKISQFYSGLTSEVFGLLGVVGVRAILARKKTKKKKKKPKKKSADCEDGDRDNEGGEDDDDDDDDDEDNEDHDDSAEDADDPMAATAADDDWEVPPPPPYLDDMRGLDGLPAHEAAERAKLFKKLRAVSRPSRPPRPAFHFICNYTESSRVVQLPIHEARHQYHPPRYEEDARHHRRHR